MTKTNQTTKESVTFKLQIAKLNKIFVENELTLTAQNKEIGIQQLSLKMRRMTSLKMMKRTLLHGGPYPGKNFNPK